MRDLLFACPWPYPQEVKRAFDWGQTVAAFDRFDGRGPLSRRSTQRQPRGQGGKLFVLRPRCTKGAPKLGNATQQLLWFGTEYLSGAIQKFLLFDCEFLQTKALARMEKRFAKEFPVRSVNQRMGSENLLQRRKRSAGSKQQSASRQFHSLFLRSGCKLPDCALSQPPRLGLHSRNKLARLPQQHLFRRVIRLPEFISESLDQVNSLASRARQVRLFQRTPRPPRPTPNARETREQQSAWPALAIFRFFSGSANCFSRPLHIASHHLNLEFGIVREMSALKLKHA